MLEGIVLKAYSGFYYVRIKPGKVVECSLRGRFRKEKAKVLPGDYVKITIINDEQGVVEELLPRETELLRPPIANVDQALVVVSLCDPVPDLVFLDRLLVYLERTLVTPVIIFNKIDLARDKATELINIYRDIGYSVISISAKTGQGVEELYSFLPNHISVFAGPSGVGKSSILNALNPGLKLKTGDVSIKSRRGKHTTRYTELLQLNQGFVADTPGFSRIDLPEITREELSSLFPEMDLAEERCRFNTCLHRKEPDCAVKVAVQQKRISPHRYKNYLQFLEEVIGLERSF